MWFKLHSEGIMQGLANLWALLGSTADGAVKSGIGWVDEILQPVVDLLGKLLQPLLILVATAGIIYVIILGVNYSRAETSDKKDEAKKRIINAIVGFVITIVLLFLLYILIENMDDIIGWIQKGQV